MIHFDTVKFFQTFKNKISVYVIMEGYMYTVY